MGDGKILSVEERDSGVVAALLVDSIYEENWNQFESEICDAIEAAGSRRIVLDMSSLTFLSSFALGIIISAAKRAEERGGRLLFAGVQEPVERVFEIAALSGKFSDFKGVDEALSADIQ